MRTRRPPLESGPEHFHGNSPCQTLPATRRRFMKTKRPGNSGGNRRHENMVDSARPEACRSPGPGVCNMGETSTTGRHKWLLPRMAALSAASLGPRELQSPKPQSQKPRARERVNSKRSLRTCTIQECRADSLESWSSTTHHQTADVRNRQLPHKAGAYPETRSHWNGAVDLRPIKAHRRIARPVFPGPMPQEIPARVNPAHSLAIPAASHPQTPTSMEHAVHLAQQTGIPKSHPAMSPASSSRALTPPYSGQPA